MCGGDRITGSEGSRRKIWGEKKGWDQAEGFIRLESLILVSMERFQRGVNDQKGYQNCVCIFMHLSGEKVLLSLEA